MPNWCNNHLILTHESEDQIRRVVDSCNNDSFFNEFVPIPEDQKENWYAWNIENWGTKWEPNMYEEAFVDPYDSKKIVLGFDTAWSPPIEFYQQLEEQGFTVEAYYFEPGMGFCGVFSNGEDEYIQCDGWSEEWIKENVPEELDEIFGISEFMSDMEELEDEE